ncbi:hypothetical protein [Desulfovibrio sp. UCD-KL4C]|uniref:hypothetical protein n=1 Tax=Desulfovibrio sp. UCD-KL4C TaxID=2578120 RepID=UPI0025C53FF7|nr:hypothetical protein [Desulfovibrio sp. UCD-KL4C]
MIKKASLRLLQRPAMPKAVISSAIYRETSLAFDIAEAEDPATELDGPLLINILVKFFHAYVYPDTHEKVVPLEQISLLLDQFVHRRLGSDILEGCIETRKILLAYGFALCMLADLPKSAHVFKSIADGTIVQDGESFTGLDIGSGTGILILAMSIFAKRNGFLNTSIVGIERNQIVAERTNDLIGRMGLGNVIVADAKKRGTYGFLENKKVHYVTNETLPSINRSLWKEDFIFICKTLYDHFYAQISEAKFFPDAILVGRSQTEMLTVINSSNCFQMPDEKYPLRLMKPYAISLSGNMVSLESVGHAYEEYIPEVWRAVLTHRW